MYRLFLHVANGMYIAETLAVLYNRYKNGKV